MQLISAFGLGAIVTALVQAWLSIRAEISKRNFQEMKECYVGFLDAMYKSEIEQTKEAALNVGYWNNRIDLVGSKDVASFCALMKETNPTEDGIHPDRPKVIDDLKRAMRKDLSVEIY